MGGDTEMRKLLPLALLALCLSGCVKAPEYETPADDRARCEKALPDSAITWLSGRTGGGTLGFMLSRDVAEARDLLLDDFRAWRPQNPHGTDTQFVRVCSMNGPAHGSRYQLEYEVSKEGIGAVRAPGRGSVVRVSDDVVLTSSWRPPVEGVPDSLGRGEYAVYVACRVPGADPEQREGAPLKGQLEDSLSNEASARVHYTHLLHSTRLLVKALGCTNKPVVPAEPPDSVK